MTVSPDSPQPPSTIEIATLPEGSTAADREPYLAVRIDIPAHTAAALRYRAPKLTLDESASMVVQLYADAPLDRGTHTLTSDEWARMATALGFSPQTCEQLVAAIEGMNAISVGGVRLKLTAEDVAILNARNALGLSAKEFLSYLWTEVMFPAWKNGVIG